MKIIIGFLLLCSINLSAAQELRKETLSSGYMETIEYSNHTYVRFHNTWNAAADFMFHDPDCKCLRENSLTQEQIKLLIEMKNKPCKPALH